MEQKKGELPMREAQSRGGKSTAARLTPDERRDRASLGGHGCAERHYPEHHTQIGSRGGNETNRRHGPNYHHTRQQTPTRFQKLIGRALAERDREREKAKRQAEGSEDAAKDVA